MEHLEDAVCSFLPSGILPYHHDVDSRAPLWQAPVTGVKEVPVEPVALDETETPLRTGLGALVAVLRVFRVLATKDEVHGSVFSLGIRREEAPDVPLLNLDYTPRLPIPKALKMISDNLKTQIKPQKLFPSAHKVLQDHHARPPRSDELPHLEERGGCRLREAVPLEPLRAATGFGFRVLGV